MVASPLLRGYAGKPGGSILRELEQQLQNGAARSVASLSASLSESALAALDDGAQADNPDKRGGTGGLLGLLKSRPDRFTLTRMPTGAWSVSLVGGDATARAALIAAVCRCVTEDAFSSVRDVYEALTMSEKESLKALYRSLPVFLASCSDVFHVTPHMQVVRRLPDGSLRSSLGPAEGTTIPNAVATSSVGSGNPASATRYTASVPRDEENGGAASEAGFARKTPLAPAAPAPGAGVSPVPTAQAYDRTTEALLPFIPFGFFVPLAVAERLVPPHALASFASVPTNGRPHGDHDGGDLSLRERFEGLSAQDADVRILGSTDDDVFVRLVAESLPFSRLEFQGESLASTFDVRRLGGQLHEALLAAEPSIGDGWVGIDELSTALPAPLFSALPLQGAAAILVFDRLQHLFEVDTEAYRVRPRRGMVGGDGSELDFNVRTTPAPHTLRYLLATVRVPTSLTDVEARMPPTVLSELRATFPTLSHFVGAHRLYVYIRGTELWTCRTQTETAAVTQMDAVAAILDLLPTDRFVVYHSWHRNIPREAYFAVGANPRAFFEAHREDFDVYDVINRNRWVVGRRGLRKPANCHAPCKSANDLLQQIALATAEAVPESTMQHCLSQDGRAMLRRLGGTGAFLSNFPQWFEISGGVPVVSTSRIRYIGHLTEGERAAKQPLSVARRS